jgi:hypothetical protein
VLDNNSGTYAPKKSKLHLMQRLFQVRARTSVCGVVVEEVRGRPVMMRAAHLFL